MTKAILDELQREGHATKKDITPSKKFMIDLFSSLRRDEILQNKSERLSPQTHIHHSDTVRSFSAKVPLSARQRRRNRLFYEFFIPVLPEHERTHVVEFRVLNSNATPTTSPLSGDIPLATSNRRDRRSWAVVVKKNGIRIYKGTRRYRPIKDGMYDVFDVTEAVASYLNENRGNLIIVIKERSRDENDDDDDDDDSKEGHDSSDKVNCASPGNGLLVLYSRNSHFFHDIYQRFTTGSSPVIAEHRQRRHSQMNGAQRRRQLSSYFLTLISYFFHIFSHSHLSFLISFHTHILVFSYSLSHLNFLILFHTHILVFSFSLTFFFFSYPFTLISYFLIFSLTSSLHFFFIFSLTSHILVFFFSLILSHSYLSFLIFSLTHILIF
ncbi:unnamed protein product [Acanthosepion pharaonis]|uniref:Uncharacterized protein n=1 Tax=Acanthosepion pharaonis TaxID=158019 RepID=A0A812AZ97_ACAPH|nr:unnamed protein product [Sepia pharaonis]